MPKLFVTRSTIHGSNQKKQTQLPNPLQYNQNKKQCSTITKFEI